jgi:Flp pilus assembly protein TadG
MRRRGEEGQAFIIVVAALGLFLLGAVGLAIDASQLYAHRQMAQAAADAAAQAGMMSIYDKTNTTGTNAFTTTAFTCTTADSKTPCLYARLNGFGSTTADVVKVDFPAADAGVTLCSDATNLTRVTIFRTINTGLLRFLGPSTGKIVAQGTAACVDVVSPVPIIVLHPTAPSAFYMNGNTTIQICGGPIRSIQVNSNSATALNAGSNSTVDLRLAGPLGDKNCSTAATGAEFAATGGPFPYPGGLQLGTAGTLIQPDSPILDPLIGVTPPSPLPSPVITPLCTVKGTAPFNACQSDSTYPCTGVRPCTWGCPAGKTCTLYTQGTYAADINPGNVALFQPGFYNLGTHDFTIKTADAQMATQSPNDSDTVDGMVVYTSGTFTVTSNASISLKGAPDNSIYKGILFFEDHTAPAHLSPKAHELGGSGCMALVGTIYLSNSTSYNQNLLLHGNPCSSTEILGEIIVDTLELKGASAVKMALNSNSFLHIRQVALVR